MANPRKKYTSKAKTPINKGGSRNSGLTRTAPQAKPVSTGKRKRTPSGRLAKPAAAPVNRNATRKSGLSRPMAAPLPTKKVTPAAKKQVSPKAKAVAAPVAKKVVPAVKAASAAKKMNTPSAPNRPALDKYMKANPGASKAGYENKPLASAKKKAPVMTAPKPKTLSSKSGSRAASFTPSAKKKAPVMGVGGGSGGYKKSMTRGSKRLGRR